VRKLGIFSQSPFSIAEKLVMWLMRFDF